MSKKYTSKKYMSNEETYLKLNRWMWMHVNGMDDRRVKLFGNCRLTKV